MSKTSLRKKSEILGLIIVLSILLTTTTALGYRESSVGSTIQIAQGVCLYVPLGATEDDSVISAEMEWTENYVNFYFGPSPMSFAKPLQLRITWSTIDEMDLGDFTLYNEDGEEIGPEAKWWGVVYYIEHFSLYYYRRR